MRSKVQPQAEAGTLLLSDLACGADGVWLASGYDTANINQTAGIRGLLQNPDYRFTQEKAVAPQKRSLSNSVKEQNPFPPAPRTKGPAQGGR